MPEATTNLEVKQDAASSTAQTTDANKSAESSTAEKTATGETKTTLDSIIQDTFKASTASSEADGKEGSVQKSNKTQEEGKEEKSEETKTEEVSKDETKKDETKQVEEDKGPIPYERFQEVNIEKVKLEKQVEDLKPLVEAQQSVIDHCKRNNVSPDQFTYWMNIAALASTNPEKVMEQLQPVLDQLQSITGQKLPEDLQKMVDNNEIPLALAKRLAVAESRTKLGSQRNEMTQQQLLQEKQQGFLKELHSSFNSWMDNKKGSDPDFVPKAKPEDADGKYEFFLNKFAVESKQGQVKSGQELVALAEKAYASVDASLKKFLPKVNGTKHVSSTRSSSTAIQAPKSLEEVVSKTAGKHGIQFAVPTRK